MVAATAKESGVAWRRLFLNTKGPWTAVLLVTRPFCALRRPVIVEVLTYPKLRQSRTKLLGFQQKMNEVVSF